MRTLRTLVLVISLGACAQDAPTDIARTPEPLTSLSPAAITWKVTVIGNTAGFDRARAWAINDSNIVVGSARTSPAAKTFAWKWRTGSLTVLPVGSSNKGSVARGINLKGDVVGWIGGNALGTMRDTMPIAGDTAFFLSAGNALVRLPNVGPSARHGAFDINDGGVAVGFDANNVILEWRKVGGVWTVGEIPHVLLLNRVLANNNAGVAVGWSWNGNQWATLFPLSGSPLMYLYGKSCASDINNKATLVGLSSTSYSMPPEHDIVYWDGTDATSPEGVSIGHTGAGGNQQTTCLDTPPRISDKHRIVATSAANLPLTWKSGVTTMLPLPLGAASGTATAVNKCGVIAGTARIASINRDLPVIWRRYNGPALVCD